MAALGGFSFGRKLQEREAQKSDPWPSSARGTESWVRRSDWGSNEKGKKALKGECAARASHLGRRGGPSRCERRSAPITIWARLQALKRTLALEAEARFLHEALRKRQLFHFMEIGHQTEIDGCARISPSLKARAGEFIATPSPLGDICTLDWSLVELVHRVRQAFLGGRQVLRVHRCQGSGAHMVEEAPNH